MNGEEKSSVDDEEPGAAIGARAMRQGAVGHLIALALLQHHRAAVGQLGLQLAVEHQQDMALLAPMIGEIARRVLDHAHPDVVEGPGAPIGLAGLTRVLGALHAVPVGRAEGYVEHQHAGASSMDCHDAGARWQYSRELMKRRSVLSSLAALATAHPAELFAQAGRIWRIGILETVAPDLNARNFAALRRGLQEHGYVEGRNLQIDYRPAEGHADRFAQLAQALVAAGVDLIVTRGTPAARAAKEATATIPIVMAAIGEPPNAGGVAG